MKDLSNEIINHKSEPVASSYGCTTIQVFQESLAILDLC